MDTNNAPTAGTTAITAGRPQVWHVDVEAGMRYRVLIDSDSSINLEQLLWAGAWSSAGDSSWDWSSAPAGSPQVLSVQPDQDGVFEVWLSLYALPPEPSVTYRLQVVEWPADDHAESGLRATPLRVGMAATGTLEDGLVRDCFALDLEAGQTVRLTARADSDAATTSLPLALMDSSGGTRVASNDAIEFTAPWAGRWVLQVGGGRCSPGSYAVASEWVDTLANLIAPGIGEMQFSRLPVAGQHQRWAFTLEADQRIDVQLSGGDGGLPMVRMTAASASLLPDTTQAETTTVYPGYDWEQRVYVLRLDGAQSRDWQIDVEALAGPVDYQLAVGRVTADDHADDPAQATALALGSTVPGRFESVGDWDWFSLMLSDEESVDIVVSGSAPAQWAVNFQFLGGPEPGTRFTHEWEAQQTHVHLPAGEARELRFAMQGSGVADYSVSVQALVEPAHSTPDELTEPDSAPTDPGYDDLGWLAVVPLALAHDEAAAAFAEPSLVGVDDHAMACLP